MRLVDSHVHLSNWRFENDLAKVIKTARRAQVETIIESGTNIRSSGTAIELANLFDDVFATIGIHPIDGKKDLNLESWEDQLIALSNQSKVVAIGECGLDYLRQPKTKKNQQILFIKQLELASQLDLPLVIHCRRAFADLFSILRSFPQARGVFHSWSGSYRQAKIAMDFNFLFGFSSIITYPNAQDIADVCTALPIWRIVLETDSPHLAPQSKRGQRNQPANIYYVAEKVAQIRGIKVEEVAQATTNNAQRMFAIST